MNNVIELPIHKLFKDLRAALGTCFVCGKPYRIELRDTHGDNVALYVWCGHSGTAAASVDGSTTICAQCVLEDLQQVPTPLRWAVEIINQNMLSETLRWQREQDERARERGEFLIAQQVTQ